MLLALAAATALLLCGTAWHVARASACSAGCEMTYMYASYTPVPVAGDTPSDARYRLVLYREDNGPGKQGGQLGAQAGRARCWRTRHGGAPCGWNWRSGCLRWSA